jgi:hypothetical protein
VNISGWPAADTATTDGFTVRAKTNEAGTAYYVVLADGATAPTAAEVKAATGSGGATALKTGNFALTADTEATATLTGLTSSTAYDVYLVAQDAATAPNLQTSATKVDITTASTPLESWRNTYWNITTDTGNAANTADPDGDGIVNLLEYALGTTPDSSASRPNLTSQISDSKLQLTFTPQRSDVTYTVEASSDLVTWTDLAMPTLTVGQSATVTDDTALSGTVTKRFLRLKVTIP